MADTSLAGLYYGRETTWKTPFAGNPKQLRFTGEDLEYRKGTVRSEEITPDRNVSDEIEVSGLASGPIRGEYSYLTYDEILACVAAATDWITATPTTGSVAIALDGGSGDYQLTKTNAFTDWTVDQWFRATGNAGANNNGFFKIKTKVSNSVIRVHQVLTPEATAPGVFTPSDLLRNSTVKSSVTLWKFFSDVVKWWRLDGMRPNTFNLELVESAVAKCSFGFEGSDGVYLDGTAGLAVPTTLVAANTNPVFNCTANVGQIFESTYATAITALIRRIVLNLNNNLRRDGALGHKTSAAIGYGDCDVSGTMEIYFEDQTLFNKYRDHAVSALAFRLSEGQAASTPSSSLTANTVIYTLPKIKFNDEGGNPTPKATARNQTIWQTVGFRALKSLSNGTPYSLQLDRFAGV